MRETSELINMATEKQMKYILYLARKLGEKVDDSIMGQMTGDQASQKIESMLERLSEVNGVTPMEPVATEQRLDKIKFGLCEKLVVQQMGLTAAVAMPEGFKKNVVGLYALMTEAEAYASASPEEKRGD